MKKRAIVVAAAAILVLLGVVYLWGPGSAPPGQEPVLTLARRRISANLKRLSIPKRTFPAWCCCCLPHERVACGGLPQPSNS